MNDQEAKAVLEELALPNGDRAKGKGYRFFSEQEAAKVALRWKKERDEFRRVICRMQKDQQWRLVRESS